jgi:2'-5' RNA ligase
MRVFVAVTLDDPTIDVALRAARDMQRRIGPSSRARWVDPAHLHLTVRFVGHVEASQATAVLAALRPPLSYAPFDIELGECGVFPPGARPRVIWIGLASGLSSLRLLHEEFDRRLLPLGYESESRPYNAHLTLARVKDASGSFAAAIREAVRAVRPSPARCHVAAATVFESRLSPRGAAYSRLFDVPLQG